MPVLGGTIASRPTDRAAVASGVTCLVAPLASPVAPWAPSAAATGFQPPEPRDGLVWRSALVDRLVEANEPIVMLRAPAGYGKTTILSQWAQADARRCVWLTLDAAHNDPELLRRDLSAAITSVLPIPFDDLAAAGQQASPESVAAQIDPDGALRRTPVPIVLVLDDAHRLSATPARRIIDRLMASVPAGSVLALASRDALPQSLVRLRVERRVLEITAPDMAFNDDEARAALATSGLPARAAQAVIDACEGWPAGICLAGLAAPVGPDRPQRWRAGREQLMVDYLRSEVLAGVDEAGMAFLTRTSILAELSGAMCDAVRDTQGSGLVLRAMRSSNLLVVPLDSQDRRYRYHPLLREALQAELERREPDLLPVLHDRASRWFAAHGDVESAIRHAKLSGDMAHTGELVWANLHPALDDGGADRPRRWLGGLTDAQIGRSPELILASAWLSMTFGDLDSTVKWQALAEARLGRDWRDVAGSELRGVLALLHAWRGADGMADAGELGSAVFDSLPPDSHWRPAAAALSGIVLALSGRTPEAHARLRAGEELARGLGLPSARVDCLAALGSLAFDRGLRRESEDLIRQAQAVVRDRHLEDLPTSAYALSVIGLALARRGQALEAAQTLDRARVLTTAMAGFAPWIQVQARVLQATTSLLLGDAGTARRSLRQARQLLDDRSTSPVLRAGVSDAETTVAQLPADSAYGLAPFTMAELRILQLLPTHLSFPEMGALLFVSRHTIKTQALSTYRKLGAASRHEAVERACALGYLPPMAVPGRIA